MMLSTALKDLAVEYNLYVESGTQLSGDYDGWEGVRNQTLIRGTQRACYILSAYQRGCI